MQVVHETQTSEPVSYESVPFQDILAVINDELRNVALRNTASVLRRRDFDGLSSFSLESMVDELKTLCPVVFRVLSEILELSYNREKKNRSAMPDIRCGYVQAMSRIELFTAYQYRLTGRQ